MKRGVVVMTVMALACRKDSTDREDPRVDIVSPADLQQFAPGTMVQVNATITDNVDIDEVHFHLVNKATGIELVHEHLHPGGTAFNFIDSFSVEAGIIYHLEIEADDKEGNIGRDEVQIGSQ